MRMLEWLSSPVRQFRHAPLYSMAVAGSLALGIAATCSAFVVVKRAFLDPLPYHDADRLLTVETSTEGRTMSVSIFVTEDLRESPLFTDISPLRFSSVTYEAPEAAERLTALEVTPTYFQALGVAPAVGTVWSDGRDDAVIVSWAFFERALAADPASLGRRVAIDGVSRQIVGVMPQGFLPPFSTAADLWMPLNMRALLADTARARRTVTVLARLAPGASLRDATAYMTVFSERQRQQYPDIHARDHWIVTPLREDLLGPSRPALVGTWAASVLLMLIVWANIAGLSAAQAAAFRRAQAVRCALGATVGRLFRERLVESATLAALGTVAGLWLAYALITVAAGYQPQFLGNMAPIRFEAATAALGIILGLVTTFIVAIVPHRAIGTLTVCDLLGSARGMAGSERLTRMRSALVLVQVAIAIVLMVSAGLLVRTVRNLSTTEMGFESGNMAGFAVMLPTSRYQGSARQVQFESDVIERIGNVPGVTGVTASVGFPAAGAMGARLTILNRPPDAPPEIVYFSVAPKFFSFLDVPITAGRDIQPTDDFDAPRVVVINEAMARMFWPNGDAIGAKVKIGAGAPTDREITVVGIAGDVRQHGPAQEVRPTAYGSTLQYSWPRRHFTVRTSKPVAALAADLRAAVHAVDPLIATPTIRAFDEHVADQTARHRLVMFILTVFGFVATTLCGFGLYAVVALTSQFRRREYAIRVALGARRRAVWWLVVRQSLLVALGGAALGLLAASVVTRTLQGLLHGVEPTDAPTFVTSAAGVIALAVMASVLPAWRAGRINPVETLKAE
jgi:putative ABC transport system permease protein